MLNPGQLAGVRRAIRRYLELPESEIVDLVILASVLLNFAPDRQLPMWLILVGEAGSGKSEITELVERWHLTHTLPEPLTAAYFISARNRGESALFKIIGSGKRILFSRDMGGFTSTPPKENWKLYSQILQIHDGRFKRATGWDTGEYEIDLTREQTLGWIGSATHRWYAFQEFYAQLGLRFSTYQLRNPFGGADWDRTDDLEEQSRRMVGKSDHRAFAEQTVHAFLDAAIAQIGDFGTVAAQPLHIKRVANCVKLVRRCLQMGPAADTGRRLQQRLEAMARMFAWMGGRTETNDADCEYACRVGLSQLSVELSNTLRYAFERHRGDKPQFTIRELCRATGGVYSVYHEPVRRLVDLEILDEQRGKHKSEPYLFSITGKAVALIEGFDVGDRLFTDHAGNDAARAAPARPKKAASPAAADASEPDVDPLAKFIVSR